MCFGTSRGAHFPISGFAPFACSQRAGWSDFLFCLGLVMSSLSLVDSHCHLDRLDLAPYGGDFGAMLAAAQDVGVERFLCIHVVLETFPAVVALAQVPDLLSPVVWL